MRLFFSSQSIKVLQSAFEAEKCCTSAKNDQNLV